MGIKLGNTDITGIKIGNQDVTKVYIGSEQIRPVGPDKDYLCFTAEQANSTVKLTKTGSPTVVTLETSTDGRTRTTYTIKDTITLNNIGDKVYWRNTSETATGFTTTGSNYYKFVMTGLIGASGDCNFLLCKDSTDTLPESCYQKLFRDCLSLTTPPKLPATTISASCYDYMFDGCTALNTAPELPATTVKTSCYHYMFHGCKSLATLPQLPAVTLVNSCYRYMFYGCTLVKLSTTQTGEYQTEYRIPITGTGTTATDALSNMFTSTGGTFTSDPTINITYYTSNTVV